MQEAGDGVSLDTIASELGVSKAALTQALTETKQWMTASTTKLSVGQFEQHLADLLHVPVAKVASVFGSELRIGGEPGRVTLSVRSQAATPDCGPCASW